MSDIKKEEMFGNLKSFLIFLPETNFKMENIEKYTKLMYRLFFLFGLFPVQNPFQNSKLKFSWLSPPALLSSLIAIVNFTINVDTFTHYDDFKKLKRKMSMTIIASGIVLGFLLGDTIYRLSSLLNCPSFVKLLQLFEKLGKPQMTVAKFKNGGQLRKNTVTIFKEKCCTEILTLLSILLCITTVNLILLIYTDLIYLKTLEKSPFSLLSLENDLYSIYTVYVLSELCAVSSSLFCSVILPVTLILNLFQLT